MLLDLLDESSVLGQNKVDCGTFLTETTSSTNSVDVVFLLVGELVVDDKADLLDINTSCKEVCCDQDSNGTLTELLHDDISLELVHLTVHHGDGEVFLCHDLLKLFDTLLCVAINQSLIDVEVGVQVDQNFDLPFFFLYSNVVLVNTFESELLVLHKDFGGVTHEMLCQAENLWWKSSGKECDLNVAWQIFENALNLFLEAAGEHFVGLIEDEDFEIVCLHESTLHHVLNTAWCADDDVDATLLENADVFLDNSSTNAGVDLDALVLTDGVDDVGNLH